MLRQNSNDSVRTIGNDLEKILLRAFVSPNPTSSYASLIFETVKKVKLNIFVADALGRKLAIISNNKTYSEGIYNERLNAENLANGIYNIVIQNGNNTILKKLVVQR